MISKRINPAENRRGLTFWGQWTCAITLVSMLLCYLVVQRYGDVPTEYRLLIVLTVLGSVPAYGLLRVYHKRLGYLTGLGHLLGGWLTLLAGLLFIAYFSQSLERFSFEIMREWALLGFLAQAIAFIPLRYFARLHSEKLRNERVSLIIGSGEKAHELAERPVSYTHLRAHET